MSNKGSKNKDKTGSQGKKIPKWKLENSKNVKKLKKEGKPYHWFKWHNDNKGQWVLHHPSKCKNFPENKTKNDDDETQDQAMAAIQEEDKALLAEVSVSSKEIKE